MSKVQKSVAILFLPANYHEAWHTALSNHLIRINRQGHSGRTE